MDQEDVVDICKRNVGPDAGTHFLRVSLVVPNRLFHGLKMTSRYEIDLDQYNNEADFLRVVEIGGGVLAERQCEKWGATWDCEHVAKQARAAAVELLHEIDTQQ